MNYCKDNGIQQQLVRHTPKQNGVAERKNRTIVEMAISMLKGKGLSKKLWAEAVNIAIYILNRSPQKLFVIKLHLKLGIIRSHLWKILKYLVVLTNSLSK